MLQIVTDLRSSGERLKRVLFLVGILAPLLLSGCDGSSAKKDSPTASATEAGRASAGEMFVQLCRAKNSVASSTDQAKTIFVDSVHEPLHEVAAEVQRTDRDLAGKLLKAKLAVEEDFKVQPPDVDALNTHLGSLLEKSRLALERIEVDVPDCAR